MPTVWQAGECGGWQGMKAFEQCQSPSPRERILQLAAEGETGSIEDKKPNWFVSPPGEWIVVRSPKSRNSLNLDDPFSALTNRSDFESHHYSSVVGQPERGLSSILTVEQAKQLNKDSSIDGNSCSVPTPVLQPCGSHRQLFINTQMADDYCPSSFFTTSNHYLLTMKTKGFLFYSGRAYASACNFIPAHFSWFDTLFSQILRKREAFISMYEYSLQKMLTSTCNLTSKFFIVHGLSIPVTRGLNTISVLCFHYALQIHIRDEEHTFCVFTVLLQIYIKIEDGFALTLIPCKLD